MSPEGWTVRVTAEARYMFEQLLDLRERIVVAERLRKIASHPHLMGALGSVDDDGETTIRRMKMFGVTFYLSPNPGQRALILLRLS